MRPSACPGAGTMDGMRAARLIKMVLLLQARPSMTGAELVAAITGAAVALRDSRRRSRRIARQAAG